jgi:hypothetical protein
MKCVPHSLINEFTKCRVTVCKGFIQTSLIISHFCSYIVARDECWAFQCVPETKHQDMEQKPELLLLSKNFHLQKSKIKMKILCFENRCDPQGIHARKKNRKLNSIYRSWKYYCSRVQEWGSNYGRMALGSFVWQWPFLFCHDNEVLPGIAVWCSATHLTHLTLCHPPRKKVSWCHRNKK